MLITNKYGLVELRTIEPYRPVRERHSRDVSDAHKFTMETAEQLALICESARTQLCCTYPSMKAPRPMFVVIHDSESTAAVCEIVRLEFTANVDPRTEIANARTWERVAI